MDCFFVSVVFTCEYKNSFASWYWEDKRIYPTVFAGAVILLLCGETVVGNIFDFVELFIYPTKWWFLLPLLLFFISYIILL